MQEEIGRSLSVGNSVESLQNGYPGKRHRSFTSESDLDSSHSYWQHVGSGRTGKRHSFSSIANNRHSNKPSSKESSQQTSKRHSDPSRSKTDHLNGHSNKPSSKELSQQSSKRHSDPSRSKTDHLNGHYQYIVVQPRRRVDKELSPRTVESVKEVRQSVRTLEQLCMLFRICIIKSL